MTDAEIALWWFPKDDQFRPAECFFLTMTQLVLLLNAGLIEVSLLNGREFFRVVQRRDV